MTYDCHPTHLGSPHPHCDVCGECAPFGDARNPWLDWHQGWLHRTWHKILAAWNERNGVSR